MGRFFGMMMVVMIAVTASSQVFAKDSKQTEAPSAGSVQKNTQNELAASTDLNFSPDGLAHDVMSLMAGLSHPIDGSTNLTVQAGTSLRIGLSF